MTAPRGDVPARDVGPGGPYWPRWEGRKWVQGPYVSVVPAAHLEHYLATTREAPHRWLHSEEPRLRVDGARFLLGAGEWLWWFEVLRVMCDEPFGMGCTFGPGMDRPETRGGVAVVRNKILFARAAP